MVTNKPNIIYLIYMSNITTNDNDIKNNLVNCISICKHGINKSKNSNLVYICSISRLVEQWYCRKE